MEQGDGIGGGEDGVVVGDGGRGPRAVGGLVGAAGDEDGGDGGHFSGGWTGNVGLLLRRVSCTADVLIFVWEFEL